LIASIAWLCTFSPSAPQNITHWTHRNLGGSETGKLHI
jgi:hypothetical protein